MGRQFQQLETESNVAAERADQWTKQNGNLTLHDNSSMQDYLDKVMGGASQEAGSRPEGFRVDEVFNESMQAEMLSYGWDRESDPNAYGWLSENGYNVPEFLSAQAEYNDFDADLLDQIMNSDEFDGMLHLSFTPEDMLDVGSDLVKALGPMGGGLSLNNASPTLIAALAQTGKFKNVTISAHGGDGGIFGTNADGESEHWGSDMLGAMFADTGVENMLFAGCDTDEVAAELSSLGLTAGGWDGSLDDEQAKEVVGDFSEIASGGDYNFHDPDKETRFYSGFNEAKENPWADFGYGDMWNGNGIADIAMMRDQLDSDIAARTAAGEEDSGHGNCNVAFQGGLHHPNHLPEWV